MPVRPRPPLATALAGTLASTALLLGACSADEPTATSAAVATPSEILTSDVPMRAVLDDVGRSVTVPERPRRVAVLNEELLDAVLILGAEPVGISLGRDQPTAAAYLQERKPDLTYLVNAGLPDAPDVGAVLTAEPDLILAGAATTPETLAGLEAVAPTYVVQVEGVEWVDAVRSAAVALSREDSAETWLGGYAWRTERTRRAIADEGNAGRSIALALWTAEGPVVLDDTSFAARVAASVGLATADPVPVAGAARAQDGAPVASVAALPHADWLFVFARDALGPDGAALDAAMGSAELRAHPAVQAGQVSVVDGSAWATRGAPAAAHLVLDGLEAAFGGVPPTDG